MCHTVFADQSEARVVNALTTYHSYQRIYFSSASAVDKSLTNTFTINLSLHDYGRKERDTKGDACTIATLDGKKACLGGKQCINQIQILSIESFLMSAIELGIACPLSYLLFWVAYCTYLLHICSIRVS